MKNKYDSISTIRYMGNKEKLLKYIVPIIEENIPAGGTICDIMAGTHSVAYALKRNYKVISNDIQYYSYVIGKALMNNYQLPNKNDIKTILDKYIAENESQGNFTFFETNYSDTYFSPEQCVEIDNIRYAIDFFDEDVKFFLLTILMSVMTKAQSSPGHFAQYMPKDHSRIIPIRKLSIYKLFFEKMDEFNDFVISNYENEVYNLDYKKLFKNNVLTNVDCIYLDSPYTADQYSRFYHVLETVSLYDNPELNFKAKYREDRHKSLFSYKRHVRGEFENIIRFSKKNKNKLIISYSNKGVLELDELIKVCNKYFDNVEVKFIDYNHSTQGRGTVERKEVLIILK